MESYKNNENINKKTYSTTFKLDIIEKTHYESDSYNDLIREIDDYIANNY